MNSAKTGGGSWFNANYEKVLLLAVLILVLISTVALLAMIGSTKRQAILNPSWKSFALNKVQAEEIDTNLVISVQECIKHPLQVPYEQRKLFVGDQRVACVSKGEPIAYYATNCPFCGHAQPEIKDEKNRDSDFDGMPDLWEKKYGLNPLDPSDAMIDTDGDGYSNLDENKAGSDPTDPTSKPEPVTKIRRVSISVEPFKLRFFGVNRLPGGGNSYQLNLRSLERTYFVTNGATVEGVQVVAFEDKDPKKPVLVLRQGDRTLRLVQGEIINEDSYSATIVSLLDRKPFKVRRDAIFKLEDTEYKVVDIRRDAVVIRHVKNGRETIVPPLLEDERAKNRGDATMQDVMRRPGTARETDVTQPSPFESR